MRPLILRRWLLAALVLALCSVPLALIAQSTYQTRTDRVNYVNRLQVEGIELHPNQVKATTIASCATVGCIATVAWPVSFADTSYVPACTVQDTTISGASMTEVLGVSRPIITGLTTAGLSVYMDNLHATVTVSAVLNCVGVAY